MSGSVFPGHSGPQAIGKSRGGWNTKIHLLAADARTAVTFSLSPGQAHDAPEGRELLKRLGAPSRPVHLLMDRAYEGNETRQLALDLGFIPVVPPMRTRVEPWEYDRAMYRRRNEVERLFRRLKGYRRIFSRFEKLDVMFTAFINFVLRPDIMARITDATRYPNAVPATRVLVKPELLEDPNVFPTDAGMQRFFTIGPSAPAADRARTRLWARFKAGR